MDPIGPVAICTTRSKRNDQMLSVNAILLMSLTRRLAYSQHIILCGPHPTVEHPRGWGK